MLRHHHDYPCKDCLIIMKCKQECDKFVKGVHNNVLYSFYTIEREHRCPACSSRLIDVKQNCFGQSSDHSYLKKYTQDIIMECGWCNKMIHLSRVLDTKPTGEKIHRFEK